MTKKQMEEKIRALEKEVAELHDEISILRQYQPPFIPFIVPQPLPILPQYPWNPWRIPQPWESPPIWGTPGTPYQPTITTPNTLPGISVTCGIN